MKLFGYYPLAGYIRNFNQLRNRVGELQPAALVYMSEQGNQYSAAMDLQRESPETAVIFRAYSPNEPELDKIMTPAEWVAQHRIYGREGLLIQCMNEPQGYTDLRSLSAWIAGVLEAATAAQIRVVAVNWGVGHPDEQRIENGEFDAALIAFARYPQHFLGVHEYAVSSPANETPYKVGRYRAFYRRADAIGVQRPRVIVTEFGRDIGGGAGDGWSAVMNEDQYNGFIDQAAAIYSIDGVPAVIYCYGYGAGGGWYSFDIESADNVNAHLLETPYIAPIKGTAPPTSGGFLTRAVMADNVNFRLNPNVSAPILGVIRRGDTVIVYPETWTIPAGTNLYWARMTLRGVTAWGSSYAVFADVEANAPGVTTPPMHGVTGIVLPSLGYNVNVRVVPDRAGQIVGVIKPGDPVVVYPDTWMRTGGLRWVEIEFNGVRRWTSEYARFTDAALNAPSRI